MTRDDAQRTATTRGLGTVHFEYRVALNTGKEFLVGYVYVDGHRELFCKWQSFAAPDAGYLCNQFRDTP